MAQALQAYIASKSAILLQPELTDTKFHVEGVAPTIHSFFSEWVNIETSYFVYSVIVASPSRRTTNRPWKGRGYVTWHVLNFECPIHISGMAEARALKFST